MIVNIYVTPFDNWINTYLKPKYNLKIRKKSNSVYTKTIGSGKVTDYPIQSMKPKDKKYLRLYYIRYAEDFLMSFNGSKTYCKKIVEECRTFLDNKLKFTLNVENTTITNIQKQSAKFLGYNIHRTKLEKIKIAINSKGKNSRGTNHIVLDGPIEKIVKKLHEKGYARKNGNPTRNGKFINHNLHDIIIHYKKVEREILQYYSLANNYSKIAARVHYILKYSCALTFASKMKLSTLRKVFKKYGKDLNIKNEHGKITAQYPTVNYKRPKKDHNNPSNGLFKH